MLLAGRHGPPHPERRICGRLPPHPPSPPYAHAAYVQAAMGRLTLNDASVAVRRENSNALGAGFRCGFLGLLHMDVGVADDVAAAPPHPHPHPHTPTAPHPPHTLKP